MQGLPHTPWDGSWKPFTIGLRVLPDATRWFEVDHRHGEFLDEKARLEALDPSLVFREEPETRAAQADILEAIIENLCAHHNARVLEARPFSVHMRGRTIVIDRSEAPLLSASRLVQEDLCLMRRGDKGWRLAAAALAFPSSWSLAEKFGQDLTNIHAPVPGFAGRITEMVTRIFDHLRPGQIVERFNWSLYDGPRLDHSAPQSPRRQWHKPDGSIDATRLFVRVERQTLRKFAGENDILFTIRVHHEQFQQLAATQSHRTIADDIRAMSADQLAYKGWTADRDALIALLDR